MQASVHRTFVPSRHGHASHVFVLVALTLYACGGKTLVLRTQQPQGCPPEYRFTATLSGNVLAFTLTKDNPDDAEDEISAVLTYKAVDAGGGRFELTPDPTGAGDVTDSPPPLAARVEGGTACIAALGQGDGAADACVIDWLSVERCYELREE